MATEGVLELIAVGFTAPTRKSHHKSEVWLNSLPPWDNPDIHVAIVEQASESFFFPIRFQEINANHVRPAYDSVVLGEKTAKGSLRGDKASRGRHPPGGVRRVLVVNSSRN